jgi:hypothetical protein
MQKRITSANFVATFILFSIVWTAESAAKMNHPQWDPRVVHVALKLNGYAQSGRK